jgi:hypothetical protein
MMLATLLVALSPLPQEPAVSALPAVTAPVSIDANGWPQAPVAERAPATADAAAAPPAPALPTPAPGAIPANSLDSPLRDIWLRTGQPSDFAAQGGAGAEIKLHLYDVSGGVLTTRRLLHEADLAVPDRDRLTFLDSQRTFGRDGTAVWAMADNVLWPSREREAQEALQVLGLLLRAPWIFADERYLVRPAEPVEVDGERMVRVAIESAPDPEGSEEAAAARFQLLCHPSDMLPLEIRYAIGAQDEKRVKLLEYQTLPPGVKVPVRRVFVAHDGRPLLEVEIVRMQCKLDLPAAYFRTPAAPPGRPGG